MCPLYFKRYSVTDREIYITMFNILCTSSTVWVYNIRTHYSYAHIQNEAFKGTFTSYKYIVYLELRIIYLSLSIVLRYLGGAWNKCSILFYCVLHCFRKETEILLTIKVHRTRKEFINREKDSPLRFFRHGIYF